jgi:signal transduction histidine kinase
VEAALAGATWVGRGYEVDGVPVRTACARVRGQAGQAVLVLEAGGAFASAAADVWRAELLALLLLALGGAALWLLGARWVAGERAHRQVLERAARAEALSRVAAAAAHEVRNPLGIIRGTVELLRERSGPSLSASDREALEDVLGEVERLKRLTEDLLELSADRPLLRERVCLGALLQEVAQAAERAFPRVQVAHRLEADLEVEGDGGRLRQVFFNLLQNAAQALGAGVVQVEAARAGSAVVARVHDGGPGIPPEVRTRLFEPFVTGRAEGTGLGLALGRRLVERHGGALRLLEGGPGTTFEVRLPAAPARQEA